MDCSELHHGDTEEIQKGYCKGFHFGAGSNEPFAFGCFLSGFSPVKTWCLRSVNSVSPWCNWLLAISSCTLNQGYLDGMSHVIATISLGRNHLQFQLIAYLMAVDNLAQRRFAV